MMAGVVGVYKLAIAMAVGASAVLGAPVVNPDEHEGRHDFSNIHHPPHFVESQRKYWFQAFPNSKVPTSSLFLIILAAGISVVFCLCTAVMRLLWSSPLVSQTRNDRALATSKLRVLGIYDEKDAPRPPPQDEENTVPLAPEASVAPSPPSQPEPTSTEAAAAAPQPVSSESDEEKAEAKDADMQKPSMLEPLPAGGKKSKDANEIVGPIVPVLRNEDPGVAGETDSEEEEEEVDEVPYGPYQSNEPTEKAPAYEPEPVAPVHAPEPEPVVSAHVPAPPTETSAAVVPEGTTERYDLPPPIEGSVAMANELPVSQMADRGEPSAALAEVPQRVDATHIGSNMEEGHVTHPTTTTAP